jgi:putative transposase
MSDKKYRKGSHTVYDLKVHLVWITKYRYKVLEGGLGELVRDLVRQVCDSKDIQIIKGRISKDHVHLYISYPPKLSVSEIMRRIKGRSSRKIQDEFPHLKKRYWGKHFWAIGYGAFSAGNVTDEMIQAYLEKHDQHGNHNDDNFVVE